MADRKISQLTEATEIGFNDSIAIVQGTQTKQARTVAVLDALRESAFAPVRAHEKPPAATIIAAEGELVPGDGGGSWFYWDSLSEATDDGVDVLAPNAGGVGRWRRLHQSFSPGSLVQPGLSVGGDLNTGLAQLGGVDRLSVVVGGVDGLSVGPPVGGITSVRVHKHVYARLNQSLHLGSINNPATGTEVLILNTDPATLGPRQKTGGEWLHMGSLLDPSHTVLTYDGKLRFLGDAGSPDKFFIETTSNVGVQHSLVLRGNRDAGDGGVDVLVDSPVTRTAGTLFQVSNAAASRLKLNHAGTLELPGTTPLILSTAAALRVESQAFNSPLTLKGNLSAGSGATDVIIGSSVTRTAGALLEVKNLNVNVYSFGSTGVLSMIPGTDQTAFIVAASTGARLALEGRRAAGSSDVDILLSSQQVRTAGSLVDVRNAGSSRMLLRFDSRLDLGGPGAAIRSTAANGEVRLTGNRLAADPNTDVALESAATRTAGRIVEVRNLTTLVASIDFAGLHTWVIGNEQTTVGAAGAASALPLLPTKYLRVKDSTGAILVVPAYAAS